MTDPTVVIIGSFLLAFKAILIEGSEVAILSLATIKQLGRNNILFGVIAGGLGSIITFLVVWRIFLLLPAIIIDFATAIVLFYFSSRFLRGFIKYAIKHKSFREKMARMGREVIEKDLEREGAIDSTQQIRFSIPNSLPVLTITLTEGFDWGSRQPNSSGCRIRGLLRLFDASTQMVVGSDRRGRSSLLWTDLLPQRGSFCAYWDNLTDRFRVLSLPSVDCANNSSSQRNGHCVNKTLLAE